MMRAVVVDSEISNRLALRRVAEASPAPSEALTDSQRLTYG